VPYRRPLVRGYDQVTAAAREAGAFGATLSGSGSAIIALTTTGSAPAVAANMKLAWRALGVAVEILHAARPGGGYRVETCSAAGGRDASRFNRTRRA
jgi:homoserine kinase